MALPRPLDRIGARVLNKSGRFGLLDLEKRLPD